MLQPCLDRGVAIITYAPIANTDLTNLAKDEVDPAVKTSARSSIWRFAWDILGGDQIYVGDSASGQVVARGSVLGEVGKRAYRYNADDAIIETENTSDPWRHEIPVEWDKDFVRFVYKDPAPQYTVFPYMAGRDAKSDTDPEEKEGLASAETSSLLGDAPYMRQTEASMRNIKRLHASLSNRFGLWIEKSFGLNVFQENNHIDITFDAPMGRHLVELKICYGANTRHAIREALGQIFEYNHYPPHTKADFWWIVLDHKPSGDDFQYLQVLRKSYGIPLAIGWPFGDGFEYFPSSSKMIV